jgi:hypothetical protein
VCERERERDRERERQRERKRERERERETRAGGMAQVVEYLVSKPETLNPRTTKRKRYRIDSLTP